MPRFGRGQGRTRRAGSFATGRGFGTPRNGPRPPATGTVPLPSGNTLPRSTGALRAGCFPDRAPSWPVKDRPRPRRARGGKDGAWVPGFPPTGSGGRTVPPPRRIPRSRREPASPLPRGRKGHGGKGSRKHGGSERTGKSLRSGGIARPPVPRGPAGEGRDRRGSRGRHATPFASGHGGGCFDFGRRQERARGGGGLSREMFRNPSRLLPVPAGQGFLLEDTHQEENGGEQEHRPPRERKEQEAKRGGGGAGRCEGDRRPDEERELGQTPAEQDQGDLGGGAQPRDAVGKEKQGDIGAQGGGGVEHHHAHGPVASGQRPVEIGRAPGGDHRDEDGEEGDGRCRPEGTDAEVASQAGVLRFQDQVDRGQVGEGGQGKGPTE